MNGIAHYRMERIVEMHESEALNDHLERRQRVQARRRRIR